MDTTARAYQTSLLAVPAASHATHAAGALAARKLLLVDDHELVRFGIRALHRDIEGVPIEWVEARMPKRTSSWSSTRSSLRAASAPTAWVAAATASGEVR